MSGKHIELYAGCGGLALGSNPTVLVERDADCCRTLRRNFPEAQVIESPVSDVDWDSFRDVDVVSGGFPCQSFSSIGTRSGLESANGEQVYAFLDVVRRTRPQYVLGENVRGFANFDQGALLEWFLAQLTSLGYFAQAKLLNAVDYGVAQKRVRLVILASRSGLPRWEFPEPDSGPRLTLRDVLAGVRPSPGAKLPPSRVELYKHIPPGGCWTSLPPALAESYGKGKLGVGGGDTGVLRRMAWDEPCLTLLTTPSQKATERCHPEEDRPFTLAEYARIQGFPDTFSFSGSLASVYRQIGNSVPPPLAERLFSTLPQRADNFTQP